MGLFDGMTFLSAEWEVGFLEAGPRILALVASLVIPTNSQHPNEEQGFFCLFVCLFARLTERSDWWVVLGVGVQTDRRAA